jgi:hypothetical protein
MSHRDGRAGADPRADTGRRTSCRPPAMSERPPPTAARRHLRGNRHQTRHHHGSTWHRRVPLLAQLTPDPTEPTSVVSRNYAPTRRGSKRAETGIVPSRSESAPDGTGQQTPANPSGCRDHTQRARRLGSVRLGHAPRSDYRQGSQKPALTGGGGTTIVSGRQHSCRRRKQPVETTVVTQTISKNQRVNLMASSGRAGGEGISGSILLRSVYITHAKVRSQRL